MTAMGCLKAKAGQRYPGPAGNLVRSAANGLSRHDYACRVALYRRVGVAWLCMARFDTIGQAIEESRPGDVVWRHHRQRKWVPLIRCV